MRWSIWWRPNLITWVAEVERSRRAGVLAERVRELGQWLAAEEEPELTKSFDLWLGALGRKWGVELPSIRDYEEASAVLLEKIDRWEAEILERGVGQGLLDSIREALELRFGPDAARPLADRLEAAGDVQRLKQFASRGDPGTRPRRIPTIFGGRQNLT